MATRIKFGLRPACCAGFNRAGNAAKLQMDKQGIGYKMKDNAFVHVDDPEGLKKIVKGLNGKAVMNRAEHWKNIFFKFDKGKYSTRSKHLEHQWYAPKWKSLPIAKRGF